MSSFRRIRLLEEQALDQDGNLHFAQMDITQADGVTMERIRVGDAVAVHSGSSSSPHIALVTAVFGKNSIPHIRARWFYRATEVKYTSRIVLPVSA